VALYLYFILVWLC